MGRWTTLSRRSVSALSLAVVCVGGKAWGITQESVWTNGAGNNLWSNPNNWSPPTVPNNGTAAISDFNVQVGAPAPTLVSQDFTVDSLTVGASAAVGIEAGDALTLQGPTLTVNGTIAINSSGAAQVTQLILNGVTAGGSGTITLNGDGNGNASRLDGSGALSAGLTVNGNGNINATLISNAIINGNTTVGALNITGVFTNNNLLEATSGGALAITGSVTGGTLATSGGGVIEAFGSGTLANATVNGQIIVPEGQAFNGAGTVTNNGNITVNNTGVAAVTQLIFSGGTLAGTGSVTLNGDGVGNASRLDGSLTQASQHTINGNGNINASIVSSGTIDGNSTLGSLNINGVITNTGLVEATAAGSVAINGTVTGGNLNTSGGVIEGLQGGDLDSATNNGSIIIPEGNTFFATNTVTDNGSIVVNPTGVAAVTSLDVLGGTIAGSGTITLNGAGNGNASRLDGALTQGAGHTINGNGNINAGITNNGAINGNSTVGSLNINGNITNNGLLESTNAGVLLINGATVAGGTLNTASGGAVEGSNGGEIINVTNYGVLNIPGGATFNVGGTLTDNGTVTVNSNQAVAGTSLVFQGATLAGTGTLNLNDNINTTSQLSGTLVQAASHTIGGFGQIVAQVTNNGTINGNVPGQALVLQNNMTTNNNLIEATGGGALELSGAAVFGGTFNTSGGGVIEATGAGNSIVGVTNLGTFDVLGGGSLNLIGAITNDGQIVINSNQAVAGTLVQSNGATLSGTGSIVFNDNIGTTSELSGLITQNARHSMTGFGQIFATVVNNGTINGNVAGQTLNLVNNNTTNNSLIESTGGGAVALQAATVTGGTFNGVLVSGGSTSTISGVTNIGTLSILGGSSLSVLGNMTDNGTIAVNPNVATAGTLLQFNGGTISGTGAIVLSDPINTAAEIAGTLTQASTHTISGFGQMDALLTNNGTVNANVAGLGIDLNNAVTNNGLMEATAGGNLNLNGTAITQDATGLVTAASNGAGSASFVNLNGATITGGMVSTSIGGVVQLFGSPDSIPATIANSGTVSVSGGNLMVVGQITGGGAISITSNGRLRLTGIAAASTAASVTISSGSLDLTNNKLVINYVAAANDPVATISVDIAQGRNGGSWNGGGINSSAAAASPSKFAVGYLDGNNPADASAHTVAANQMIVAYTLAGDAFLQNSVGFADLVVVAENFGATGKDWAQGDFNYDPAGSVGFADLVSVAENFGATSGVSEGALSPGWLQNTAVVPEPGGFAILGLGILAARSRRRTGARMGVRVSG